MDINTAFQWQRQPRAESLIRDILTKTSLANPTIAQLGEDLLLRTNTRLFDWLDFVAVEDSEEILIALEEAGFEPQGNCLERLYFHPGAQLPRILLEPFDKAKLGLGLSVDSIADFLMIRGVKRKIMGSYFGNFRRALFSLEHEAALWLVERRGTHSLQPTQEDSYRILQNEQALEKWMIRSRPLQDEDQAMEETLELTELLVKEVGQHRAAWTVLEGERRYWQFRNMAGQIQKNRQDRLGMGWANHDHHTFRSSRKRFHLLVSLFEILGFQCRERFYAGDEAGWGAQVMENPVCRLVLFLDVDLAPGEIVEDFAHTELPELKQLGTIGLWCALHGDSILKAGMHHLEAQFMFEELSQDLALQGIHMMQPFSTFSYLKQAFTVGENWQVNAKRLSSLVENGQLTQEKADLFISQGALGSHLENLQRREGYKGFNQKNVSSIIKETDPRLQP